LAKRLVSGIVLTLFFVGTLVVTLNVRNVNSWSNGGFSTDPDHPNYGTHDWIAQHALDWLPTAEKEYITHYLATYLYGTELPDNGGAPDGIGDTFKHHIYYWSNGSLQDDASAVRAREEYFNALNYYKNGSFSMAVKALGIMSHYIVDASVFGHVMGSGTDWGAEVHHSDYEDYVNARTDSYSDEFNSYLSFDGSLDLVPAYDATLAIGYDTTFDVDGDLTCVWMDNNYNWANPTFRNRAGESLNLAVNYLADVLHRFYVETLTARVQNINTSLYYTKIQDAINANQTLDGHTLKIFSGIYYENVIVNKGVSLVGEDRSTTGVDGSYSGNVINITANNVNIKNLTIENSGPWLSMGIFIFYSNGNTIDCNTILNNALGIYINTSSSNIINRNRIVSNMDGFGLRSSFNNNITDNDIANNDNGMWLWKDPSSGNRITGNNITANRDCGFALGLSASNNSIYHNNFVNNPIQVLLNDTSVANIWDNGYPSGGNYWSDYEGSDLLRGVLQNEAGSDGIGDIYYVINENNTDFYPLMGSFGPSTRTGLNVTVFPTTDVGMIFENVIVAGSTTVNKTPIGPPPPPGRELVGQFYDVRVTASYSGNITIRIIYDDSGMTLEEEIGLQMLQWWLDPCDITGAIPGESDDICDMRDIGYLCTKFMTTPSSPDWNPKCDVSGVTPGVPDGIVDMRDIGFACAHFGKTAQWVDITLFIDTVNNLIFGETSHFSLIGIHRE